MNSPATPNAISLPGSADGAKPCSSQESTRTPLSGPAAHPASPSAQPGSRPELATSATSGPRSSSSFRSAGLRFFLASRLRARLPSDGSMEYKLTWKERVTPLGLRISALRAQAHPISASGSTGWPSPKAKDGREWSPNAPPGSASGHGLGAAAQLVGWATPMSSDGSRSDLNRLKKDRQTRNPAMPGSYRHELPDQVQLVGWNTPRATDGSNGGPNQAGGALSHDAQLVGWATTTTRDWRSDRNQKGEAQWGSKGRPLARQVLWAVAPGEISTLSTCSTGKRGALNPDHSRWLMGYPAAWGSCGATAMLSCRRSPRSSSKPSSKPESSPT